jgi:predicted small lipoprotein YifL
MIFFSVFLRVLCASVVKYFPAGRLYPFFLKKGSSSMRFVTLSAAVLLLFLSGCGAKNPQPDDQTAAPDSTLVAPAPDSTIARPVLPDSLLEKFPMQGDPVALADTTLAYGRAGALYQGMPIDSVFYADGAEQIRPDEVRVDGRSNLALKISLPGGTEGNPSLVAELRDNIARRIRVYDPRFRTANGMGQGSNFGELRVNYQVGQVAERDGDIIAAVNEPGIFFVLDPSEIPSDFVKTRDQNLIPGTARVTFMFVWGKLPAGK